MVTHVSGAPQGGHGWIEGPISPTFPWRRKRPCAEPGCSVARMRANSPVPSLPTLPECQRMGHYAIGQSVPRFEDLRLVRGGGRYVDDFVLPGMAFGHVLRSPHAHARITSIDTARARAAPGVLAVLTGADWQASGFGDLPVAGGMKLRDGSPMYRPKYPALVKDRVRWVGDYVAFVVAETRHQAMDAAELIAVDYAPLA